MDTKTCPYCQAEVPVKIGNADGEHFHMMTEHLDIVNERLTTIGEEPLDPPKAYSFHTQREDDCEPPQDVHISVGGVSAMGRYYYIFRGDPVLAAETLEAAAKVARAAANGEISIDDRRSRHGGQDGG